MARTAFRRLFLAAAVVPLALGLAACKKDAGTTAAPSGPVAAATPPAGKAWTDVVNTTPEGGYVVGNPAAPVKIMEYGSLSCPHCAHLAQEGFATLFGKYIASGKASLEFRSFAIHPQDVPLTMLAQCGGTEKFFPLVEEIYRNFDALTESTMKGADAANKLQNLPDNQRFVALSDALGFTDFFAQRGIAKDQSKTCLADFGKATALARQSEAYGQQGIESTPTLFINGTKVEGSTWAELNAALQRAGVS